MKQVKCIVAIPYFTVGKVYDVTRIDNEGDVWVEEDDDGHAMFFYPDECEAVDAE